MYKPPNIDFQKLLRGEYEPECARDKVQTGLRETALEENVLKKAGLLHRPVVDEYYLTKGGKRPTWPRGKAFVVCLTHDVDAVSRHSLRAALRRKDRYPLNLRYMWPWTKNIFRMGKGLVRAAVESIKGDPLHCYEEWLYAEEEVGAKSTFFFWAGKESVEKSHQTDCRYDMDDRIVFDGEKCNVAEMMKEMDRRGWEIGLHPSWYSFDDVSEMKRQKESIEKALGHEIVSVRQHRLHYDMRITPRVHAEAGLKFDSTLGFSTEVGFRFGTSYPWMLHDLREDRSLEVTEIPPIVQEGALLRQERGLVLEIEDAFRRIVDTVEKVESVGGILTMNWHPNYINRRSWFSLYLKVHKCLRKKDPWFASVSEVGTWWKENK